MSVNLVGWYNCPVTDVELVGVTLTVNVSFPAETAYEMWFGVEPPADPSGG